MKQKFNIINSTCVPLPLENVDTDQIIPARFLKATTKEGFGENLFRDWRYDKQGNKIESFVLNDPTYGGQILVAGKNFGSGTISGFRKSMSSSSGCARACLMATPPLME